MSGHVLMTPCWVLATTLVLVGCNNPTGPAIPPTMPVQGQVIVGGKPAYGVRVVFHPQFDIGPTKFSPSATTDREGKFRLGSGAGGNGAPVGEYLVTFVWPVPGRSAEDGGEEGDQLRGRYRDPNRNAPRVHIREGVNDLQPFRLD